MKDTILEMEKYAQEHNVPIIEKKSISFIMKLIKDNNIKNILEIGSAIGYSAILMASVKPDVNVTTIERDNTRYLECLKNVKACGLDKKINVAFQDALDINLPNDVKYDMIFIDAAKGQYTKFFEKFKFFLNDNGIIVTDNINFHGYVGKSETLEKGNLKSLVEKIEGYIDFLEHNEEFDTTFYQIGDGLSLSVRKKHV